MPPLQQVPGMAPAAAAPVQLSVGSLIRFGWETFKKRPWMLIGGIILIGILQWVGSILSVIINGVGTAMHMQAAAGIVGFLASFLWGSIIAIGLVSFVLKAHDNIETVRIGDIWHPQVFWKFIGTLVLFYIIVVGGLILFIIPGIIAALAFSFSLYLVIDRGLGPVEALKESARITKGNRWRLLALGGAGMLVMLLGLIVFLVGIFVAAPVFYLAFAHAYRQMSAAAQTGEHQPLTGGEKALVAMYLLIPVLGIVSSIMLATLTTARAKGLQAQEQVNIKQIQIELELYAVGHDNAYPATLDEVSSDAAIQGGATGPFNATDYSYTPSSDGKSYELCTNNTATPAQNQCVSSEDSTSTLGQ